MSGNRDDELARTATAAGGAAEEPPKIDPIGTALGRYKLERELGSGGMGVVHAAFDPDLERRVALKVLRTEGSSDARKRLLDEARAMARLQHPNVVTVHEVDSANGRDFVAMEMIDGETLADWMRSARRAEGEIIDAFVAAGRGLAAAHAEGIVHRDFKPHNVLRSRKGRIAVTDFGLARSAALSPADALAETRELKVKPGTPVSGSKTPSSPLGGNTVTGTLLGTPAYMAPEQWAGGALTPATDQFAFCVALWEALSGERPFKGPTVETLREEVARGPAKLDASKIPRRLRPALLRGLDPDPARRWPSMDALLEAMGSGERKSRAGYIVAGSALTAGVAVLVAIKVAGGAAPDEPACRAPLQSVDQIWSAGHADKLRAAGQGPAAEMIDADARAWTAARAKACTEGAQREPQLACLDGVLARLDAVARGSEALGPGKRHVDVGFLLVDPAICAVPLPPRLAQNSSPQMRATIAAVFADEAWPGRTPQDTVKQVIEGAKGDPCAVVYANYLAVKAASTPLDREPLLAEVAEAAERCSDDRVRAEIALINAQLALESGMLNTSITSKVKLAELAAQRVMQEDILANMESLRGEIAKRADQLDDAIARAESSMQHYAKRGRVSAELQQALAVLDLKQTRAKPEDFVALAPGYDALVKRAKEKLGPDDDMVREIERAASDWQFRNGDAAGAFKRLEAAYKPIPNEPSRKLKGRVVDAKGAPVAGARVAAGRRLSAGPAGVTVPLADTTRITTTGPDGAFEIPDATEFGTVVASSGDLRSLPQLYADDITLQLMPTGTITGRVDLHGEPYQSVIIVAIDPDNPNVRYGYPSPVAPDGTFEIAGTPRKKLRLFAVIARNATRQEGAVDVDLGKSPKVDGVKMDIAKSKRVVHIVVRSTFGSAVGNAAVLVLPGKLSSMSAKQLRQTVMGVTEKPARQIEGERAPAPVVRLARPGDMFATMTEVPEGAASACAIALPGDLADPQLSKKIDANLDKLKIECVPIPDGAEAVVIEVPPFPRLD